MPACASIFVIFPGYLPRNIYHAQYFCGLSPPPYNFHAEYSSEVDAVTLERLISELSRMLFAFIGDMKTKLIVGVLFVLFVPTASARYDGR